MAKKAQLVSDSVSPHSLEAEAAVLGGLLLHPETFGRVVSVLDVDDFFRTAHRWIYVAMRALRERGAVIDFITVKDELGPLLDDAGGPAYISSLIDGLPAHANLEEHAKIVREKSRLRHLIAVAQRIERKAYSAEQPSNVVLEVGVRELIDVSKRDGPSVMTAHSAATAYLKSIEDDSSACWPTGFIDLDAITRGVRAGEVMVVGGRPSSGKTSMGLAIARGIAKQSVGSAVFSCEMKAEALAARLIAWDSHVPASKLERKEADEAQYTRVSNAWSALDGLPLSIETGASTVTQIAAVCERLRQEQDLSCIVIDYLQKLLPDGKHESRESAVAHVSSSLQRLAREEKLGVVVLAQLARASDKRRDKRPRLTDLRESGSVEQDADVVVLLYRPEMHNPTAENAGVAEAIVAKQRSGPIGVAKLAFIKELAMFANLDVTHDDDERSDLR